MSHVDDDHIKGLLELTRELTAVRLSSDGKTLLEHEPWDGGPLETALFPIG